MPTFIAVQFVILKSQKPSVCSPTDEWIKWCHFYTMDYYSAINKNKLESFVEKIDALWEYKVKWSNSNKLKYHMVSYIWISYI